MPRIFRNKNQLKRAATAVLVVACTLTATSQQKKAAATKPAMLSRPKLVVGLVIDQMRWDYLYRYYNRYSEGGFKRLLHEGFSCENTYVTHLPSATAVGHTAIYTGSVPAIHGITGNEWIERATGREMYCTDDSTVHTIGSRSMEGRMSPANLLASTITDQLGLATNFQSKVISISLKDRASILPGGHHPTGAFWFDDASGNFITSSWYMNDLPQWVNAFNSLGMAQKLMANNWDTIYPLGTYTSSTADASQWEGKLAGENTSTFPHNTATAYSTRRKIIRNTPFGNTLTLEFARAAIRANKLGNNGSTDFLAINCAATDGVGHMFGPNSVEEEDTFLRLDRDLAAFFTDLDAQVGKGNYTVFLAADHGASNSIPYLKQQQIPSNPWPTDKLLAGLNNFLHDRLGPQKLVTSLLNYMVFYDLPLIGRDKKLNIDEIKALSADYLRSQAGVQFVIDPAHLNDAAVLEEIKTMAANSFNYKRSGALLIIPEPGWFSINANVTGTNHGVWNPNDTHIPLLFMGWGIRHGQTNRKVGMTDIAPTLAALLKIQEPNGCVGKPITEVLQ